MEDVLATAADDTPVLIHTSNQPASHDGQDPLQHLDHADEDNTQYFDCNDTPTSDIEDEDHKQYHDCSDTHVSEQSSIPALLERCDDSSQGSTSSASQNDKPLLFYYDPSDEDDDDSIGVPATITFMTSSDCTDAWPDELGFDQTCSLEDPTTLPHDDYESAMVTHVLGLDEEDLDNYFDPQLVPPILKSKYTTSVPNKQHLTRLEKYFAYRPPEIIKKTLERTTQLAKAVIRFPLRRHMKARFRQLRWPRLNEVVATDTYFSSVTSIEGYNCSQVFYGLSSKRLHIEGMTTESHFPDAYMDFICKKGIPHTLRHDNAKAEKSKRVQEIHRDLIIADEWTEPHSPWQNPAELHGVKYLKDHGQTPMNRTHTPDNLWFLCHQYLVNVYNVCAHPQLNWQIPDQVAGGDTTDISHLLCFYWMEPVLYLDPNEKSQRPRRNQDTL